MSQRVIILGAGGHGQVVADILWQMRAAGRDVTPIGYLDDNPALTGQRFQDLPVLGILADLALVPHEAAVVAVGNNATRRQLYDRLAAEESYLQICCHPSAVVAAGVVIGPGTMICAGVVVNPGSVIGANVILNTSCTVDHHNQIGDHVHIAPGVHLGGDVRIGAGTLIGIGATVIPQRSVGAWSMIGAGSIVTKNVTDGVVAVGIPARVIRKSDQGNFR